MRFSGIRKIAPLIGSRQTFPLPRFTETKQVVLAARRVLSRDQAEPCCHVPRVPEPFPVAATSTVVPGGPMPGMVERLLIVSTPCAITLISLASNLISALCPKAISLRANYYDPARATMSFKTGSAVIKTWSKVTRANCARRTEHPVVSIATTGKAFFPISMPYAAASGFGLVRNR